MDVETILDLARKKMLEQMADEVIYRLSRELTLTDLNFVLKLLGSKEVTEYPPEMLVEPKGMGCFPWRKHGH
jgi:hypothetical protein